MICPHCNIAVHEDLQEFPLFARPGDSVDVGWSISAQLCPNCKEPIVNLIRCEGDFGDQAEEFDGVDPNGEHTVRRIWPSGTGRQCPAEVSAELREDFEEAASVAAISPKASAALSRRCLQHLLIKCANVKSRDLSKQIQEVIDSHSLTSDLAGQLDAIRNIGNFAAHPQKDTSTGEILPVEPQEAEWNLDVLEELFDHYFVKPARIKKRKELLNQKLAAAGKPQLPT